MRNSSICDGQEFVLGMDLLIHDLVGDVYQLQHHSLLISSLVEFLPELHKAMRLSFNYNLKAHHRERLALELGQLLNRVALSTILLSFIFPNLNIRTILIERNKALIYGLVLSLRLGQVPLEYLLCENLILGMLKLTSFILRQVDSFLLVGPPATEIGAAFLSTAPLILSNFV